MRIGLDLYGSRMAGTGGNVYVRGLLRGLAAVDPANTYALFGNPLALRLPANFRYHLGHRDFAPVDVWHFPEASSPHLEGFARGVLPLPPGKGTRTGRGFPVASVHDVIFELRPEEFSPQARALFAGNIRGAAAAGALFLAPSGWSRETLAERFAIPRERIRVIPLAADGAFRPGGGGLPGKLTAVYRLTGPYILFVGSSYPRKNLAAALRAFALLRTDHLLVAAGVSPRHGMRLAAEIMPPGCEQRVRFPGLLPRAHLIEVYRAADAVLYPSFAEGFGLPVVEAMASGVPVVAAAIPSIREVAGDAALLVDPSSAESIAAGLDRALGDAELRRQMIAAGLARAAAFSWEATARLTVAAYALRA